MNPGAQQAFTDAPSQCFKIGNPTVRTQCVSLSYLVGSNCWLVSLSTPHLARSSFFRLDLSRELLRILIGISTLHSQEPSSTSSHHAAALSLSLSLSLWAPRFGSRRSRDSDRLLPASVAVPGYLRNFLIDVSRLDSFNMYQL